MPGDVDIFAIRRADGKVIAALPVSFGELVASWPPATDDPSFFRIGQLGGVSADYLWPQPRCRECSRAVIHFGGTVGRVGGAYSLLTRVLVVDIVWIIPILVVVTSSIGILAIRGGPKPARKVSELAAGIGPNATSARLPEDRLPSEISPLVIAMDRALDLLEQGFAVQRQFTANAAHELRTPLAIVTMGLDAMEGNGELIKLRSASLG